MVDTNDERKGEGPEDLEGIVRDQFEALDLGELFSWREGPTINRDGDRLLVRGKPGAVERMLRYRQRTTRIEAENRIRGHLERIPGLLEVLDDRTTDALVNAVRSISHQTAESFARYFLSVCRGALEYIPPEVGVPHPEDLGKLVSESVGTSGQTDPLDLESPPHETDPQAEPGLR